MSCLEDSVTPHFSPFSGSYIPSVPSSVSLRRVQLWVGDVDTNVPVRAEHSTVILRALTRVESITNLGYKHKYIEDSLSTCPKQQQSVTLGSMVSPAMNSLVWRSIHIQSEISWCPSRVLPLLDQWAHLPWQVLLACTDHSWIRPLIALHSQQPYTKSQPARKKLLDFLYVLQPKYVVSLAIVLPFSLAMAHIVLRASETSLTIIAHEAVSQFWYWVFC